jgi:two-component system, NtrC family, response regulator GlrR
MLRWFPVIEASIIGRSVQHCQLLEKLTKVASTDAEILFTGPSGVGKEIYARFVHKSSPRQKSAFVPVNCGALPADLLENELFGHVGGAFTGARVKSEGLVAAAEGGMLFLDEVDSLPLAAQVKLLRFLQEKEYRRLGETSLRRADIRVLAATNSDLVSAVREGRFRQDLFFRLRVVPIEVPPLCERREDIELLLDEFARRFAAAYQLPRVIFSRPALDKLKSYSWPGNIRELENCVNYLTSWQLGRPIMLDDLPLLNLQDGNGLDYDNDCDGEWCVRDANPTLTSMPYNEAKRDLVDHFEREYVEDALRRSHGNIGRAARESQKPRRVFFEMMRKHGIKASAYLPS